MYLNVSRGVYIEGLGNFENLFFFLSKTVSVKRSKKDRKIKTSVAHFFDQVMWSVVLIFIDHSLLTSQHNDLYNW